MVYEKVLNLITDLKGEEDDSITKETLLTELNLDSLDIAELIMNIEDEFNTTVDERESLKSIGDVVEFIEKKIG
ncbi:MAG: phosphopantetheine-binding protein [Eubacteriales bacterium]|nr:phosphopantetheine-binding protein [Eubacteriales bacterium]MDD4476139.1 phosphopantetheine-binding protein [Eubacteriales bacterium]